MEDMWVWATEEEKGIEKKKINETCFFCKLWSLPRCHKREIYITFVIFTVLPSPFFIYLFLDICVFIYLLIYFELLDLS